MFPQVSGAFSHNPDNTVESSTQTASDEGMVLLAVDEASIGRMLVRVFSQAGLRVHWVRDLAEALGWIRGNERKVALAFLDCHQTELESLVFCRCARNLSPGLPVMLAGGAADKGIVESLATEGESTLVTKPYLPTELTWQLKAHMRRATG